MADEFKVVCGWCGKHLRGDPSSPRISHGMCADCEAKWRREAGMRKRNPKGRITRRKARLILHHGEVRGHALTPAQRRFFGARASGYPYRRNGLAGSMWKGMKAGYHHYRAGRLETAAREHRRKAVLNPRWDVGERVEFRRGGRTTLPAHRHLNIPGKALEIRYLRSDGKRYFHPFEHNVRMIANRDGSVTLRGSKRIWADDGEHGFWERYGHGRHRNPVRRQRRQSGGTNWFLIGGLGLLAFVLMRQQSGAVSTGGQAILPQSGESIWFSDTYQGGGGEYFTGSLPPGASPPWRLASAAEIGSMQTGLMAGALYDAGGGLVAPAPGFLT